MPLPFIIAGAAAVGIGAQADAKKTNERAHQIAEEAKCLYNSSKHSLDIAQKQTENSLLKLGNAKKQILETSVNQFLAAYERIKNIEFSESVGLDEIKNFILEKQDALQLREMSSVYQSAFSSGAAGAATGAVIALAASGSLPVVTGTLSAAGTVLATGEIGMAAGLASSALSFGAAMTPLAAIAAPAMLFSGISASLKADENLEKAQTMYKEANVASEQMKTSEVLCGAIADRADMFDNLLHDLNGLFAYCTAMLDGVTQKKMGIFKNKTVDAKTFTEEELKLVAVTRSLAGAVKAVIDTPILTNEGVVSNESEAMYEDVLKQLPAFTEDVGELKEVNYHAKPILIKAKEGNNRKKSRNKKNSFVESVRKILSFIWKCIVVLLSGVFILAGVGTAIDGSLLLGVGIIFSGCIFFGSRKIFDTNKGWLNLVMSIGLNIALSFLI